MKALTDSKCRKCEEGIWERDSIRRSDVTSLQGVINKRVRWEHTDCEQAAEAHRQAKLAQQRKMEAADAAREAAIKQAAEERQARVAEYAKWDVDKLTAKITALKAEYAELRGRWRTLDFMGEMNAMYREEAQVAAQFTEMEEALQHA